MEEYLKSADYIVKQLMYAEDAFSQWLGIEIDFISQGSCRLSFVVKDDMLNGFGICHGGVLYSFADSALAFASNSLGFQSFSIETHMSHVKKVALGDKLSAQATQKFVSERFGIYEVEIKNQHNDIVGLFKGTVYKSGKKW
ncbi:MAG: hotdog fold thioesterase [Saprospiraceae bacterium]|nr:hotdog fold thioesterase [Saprospiraceae bacterium]